MKDEQYWNQHYAKFREQAASPFCRFCITTQLRPGDSVVEIGCGNGRDGLELATVSASYLGLDTADTAVSAFAQQLAQRPSLSSASALAADAARFDFSGHGAPTRLVVYSRFSLHAMDAGAEQALLDGLARVKQPWLCLIEARTIFDELYGVGQSVGRHEFITDHYRRFLDPDEFLPSVAKRFSVRYFEVSKGFAPYGAEDPTVMRITFAGRS